MCTWCFITYHYKQKSSTSIKTTQTELIHMIPHKKKPLHLTPLNIIMEPEKWTPEISEIPFWKHPSFSVFFWLFPTLQNSASQGLSLRPQKKITEFLATNFLRKLVSARHLASGSSLQEWEMKASQSPKPLGFLVKTLNSQVLPITDPIYMKTIKNQPFM